MNPWLGMACVVAALAAVLALAALAKPRFGLGHELSRKMVHIGMGLVALTLPWLFHDAWPVLALAGGAVILLLAAKALAARWPRVGAVLWGVNRTSLGEVYFPISIGLLAVLSAGRWELFAIPVLILSLADSVAALVGVRYGTLEYQTLGGRKSAEGSAAFLLVAFLSVLLPLLLWTGTGRREVILIALLIGLLVMMLEAVAWRGLDNLLIPIGTLAFLRHYLTKSVESLLLRLAVTLSLAVFVMLMRRRTTLNGGAMIAAVLFGYAAAMLGGPAWLAAPVAVFLVHLALWPRGDAERRHDIVPVLSITSGGLFWLVVQTLDNRPTHLPPYACAFAAHLAIIAVSYTSAGVTSLTDAARLLSAIALGLGVGLVPSMVWWIVFLAPGSTPIAADDWARMIAAACAAVAVPAVGFALLKPALYAKSSLPVLIHIAAGVLAFAGSLAMLLGLPGRG